MIVGRFLWVLPDHPAHCDEIAEAFGSVGYIYGTPQVTRNGDRMTFIQTTTNGVGVFLCKTTIGQKQLITEIDGEDEYTVSLKVWPWSPDDKLFLYSQKNTIVVCEGNTGGKIAKVTIGNDAVVDAVWLTPDSFACVGQSKKLYSFVRRDGKWTQLQAKGVKADSASFSALSSNTVVWLRANCIWAANLDSNSVSLLYKAPLHQILTAFAWSKSQRKFLLKLKENSHAALWTFNITNSPVKIADCPVISSFFAWLDVSNDSYTYLYPKSYNNPKNTLAVQSPSRLDKLFLHGVVGTYTASLDGRHIFIVGSRNNELAKGIWQYDVSSQSLRCIIPDTDHPSPYARHIEALHDTFKTADGHKIEYDLYPPANFNRNRHKKYPLVIGDTVAGDPLWAGAAACCGAYVVIVNRGNWFGGLDRWGTNVMEVYRHLASDPTIDLNRVYLFGTSAETSPLSELVEEKPQIWKGLLLLNPTELPPLNAMPPNQPVPKMLISAGEAEHRKNQFEQYQMDAGQNGIPVDVLIHPNSTHLFIPTGPMRERIKAMMNFIFDN